MTPDINLTPLTQDLAVRIGENPGKVGLILPGDDVAAPVRDVARAQLALYDRSGRRSPGSVTSEPRRTTERSPALAASLVPPATASSRSPTSPSLTPKDGATHDLWRRG